MSETHGFNSVYGAVVEGTPGTEQAVQRRIAVTQFAIDEGSNYYELIPREALQGDASREDSDLGLHAPAPPFTAEMTVDLRDPILENFFGQYTDGRATVTLTVDTQPTPADTMTLGTTVYTFQANGSLTNVANNIEIGTTLTATKANIVNAINRSGTPGTGYAALTAPNPSVSADPAFVVDALTIRARIAGSGGDSIASTETFTAVTNIFSGATLSSGASCYYTMLSQIGTQALTLASDLVTGRYAWRGVKVSQINFATAGPAAPLMMQVSSFAIQHIEGSSVNTSAVVRALPPLRPRLFHYHAEDEILLGDCANALVSPGDNVLCEGLTVLVNRQMIQLYGQSQIPVFVLENNRQDVVLTLNHPVLQSTDAVKAWQAAGTRLQAQITLTRGSNSKIFKLPNLKAGPFPLDVGGPELVKYSTTFLCHANPGLNPYMAVANAIELEEV